MKDLELVVEREEIHDYLRRRWRLDLFRRSHDDRGFVHRVVDRFASLPRLFFAMSDERNEHAHFSAWWGAIPHRRYDSDAVHDLYWLHEITHAAEMLHLAGLSPEGFARKMFDNELLASVRSEIQAYFELPGLREASFDHPIYADRFLDDPEVQAAWRRDPERTLAELTLRRRDVMFTDSPADEVEKWIRKFSNQNMVWAAIWERRYDEVEAAMAGVRAGAAARGRRAAGERHLEWLTSAGVTLGTAVPFPREAEAFAAVYWKNKADYEEDVRRMRKTADDRPH
jgi:hypothetical protein